jgi:hypothetical protein
VPNHRRTAPQRAEASVSQSTAKEAPPPLHPAAATALCKGLSDMLAGQMRKVFPITRMSA